MQSFYFIYTLLGILILICIALAIINWITLARLGSRAVFLEEEIRKKALEFASIRKELQQSRARMDVAGTEGQPELIPSSSGPETSQIEVVRSVRHGYGDPAVHLKQETVDLAVAPKHEPEPVVTPGAPIPESSGDLSTQAQPPSEWDDSEVLGIAGQDTPGDFESPSLVIPVYSPSSKDTDFHFVWKTLSEKMAISECPRVCLDFRNILFLYDTEVGYLEQMKKYIEQQNGSLHLVQCEQELRAILCRIPSLAPCVSE